jgi:prevent-host-death family protein
MTKTIPAVKARQQFGTILNEVELKGTNVIIERDKKPMAVMVSYRQYEAWQRRRERFFQTLDEVSIQLDKQLKAEGKTQKDLEKLINDEVQAVRKERADRNQTK